MKIHYSQKKHIGNQCHCRYGSPSPAVGSGVGINEGSTLESNKDESHINPYSKSLSYSISLLCVFAKTIQLVGSKYVCIHFCFY